MAIKPKAKDKIVAYKSVFPQARSFFETPLGTLGFQNLLEPDELYKKLSCNVHFDDAGAEALAKALTDQIVDPLWAQFCGEVAQGLEKPTGVAWVEDHLTAPKEGAKNQTPYIRFSAAATYKKDGVEVPRVMAAWDAKGNLLDIAALRIGMGSKVTVLLAASLGYGGLLTKPAIVLKLRGIRVLELKQWGGGGGKLREFDVASMGFEAEDLSAYTKSTTPKPAAPETDEEESPF
jgi:hypothetical protein